jgi:hypothetical protein
MNLAIGVVGLVARKGIRGMVALNGGRTFRLVAVRNAVAIKLASSLLRVGDVTGAG